MATTNGPTPNADRRIASLPVTLEDMRVLLGALAMTGHYARKDRDRLLAAGERELARHDQGILDSAIVTAGRLIRALPDPARSGFGRTFSEAWATLVREMPTNADVQGKALLPDEEGAYSGTAWEDLAERIRAARAEAGKKVH